MLSDLNIVFSLHDDWTRFTVWLIDLVFQENGSLFFVRKNVRRIYNPGQNIDDTCFFF